MGQSAMMREDAIAPASNEIPAPSQFASTASAGRIPACLSAQTSGDVTSLRDSRQARAHKVLDEMDWDAVQASTGKVCPGALGASVSCRPLLHRAHA